MLGSQETPLCVVKISGQASYTPFGKALKDLVKYGSPYFFLVITGGKEEIDEAFRKAGLKSRRIRGMRYTPEKGIPFVRKALLKNAGLIQQAMGEDVPIFHGEGWLSAIKLPRLGMVGHPIAVRNREDLADRILTHRLAVITPLGALQDGRVVNINADLSAAQLAIDLGASLCLFFTNIDAVYTQGRKGQFESGLSIVTTDEASRLVEEKRVSGGMIPKLMAACQTAAYGIPTQILEATVGNLYAILNGDGCFRQPGTAVATSIVK
ncbi:hypothetical protein HYU72_00290 [Candidatus Berkelbacteria bacterium]|nr:hypothetical protein [Candidatus Berkelbacteria bacterium]